jgi:flagellar hook-length control protein FliK
MTQTNSDSDSAAPVSGTQTGAADAPNGQTAPVSVPAPPQLAADATNDAPAPDPVNNPAPVKPVAKSVKSANDNDATGSAQPAGAQPDPTMMAEAQAALAAVQAPQQQVQQAAPANDDGGGDDATVDASGKPAPRPVSAGQTQPDRIPAAANDDAAQSPAAAARAAIKGAGGNANSGNSPGPNPGEADKTAPAKTADNNAPQIRPEQPQAQTAAPQSPAATTAAPAAANSMPVQTAAPSVTASVQVAPHVPAAAPNLNSLAVDIAARSQSGAKEFSIRLDPPELGRVDVRLSIDATGKAEAHLSADHPETLNLLQKDSATLTQALRDSGLDVSQRGLNFSLRGQNSQSGNDQGGQGRGARSSLAATRQIDAVQSASNISYIAGASRLDIHV